MYRKRRASTYRVGDVYRRAGVTCETYVLLFRSCVRETNHVFYENLKSGRQRWAWRDHGLAAGNENEMYIVTDIYYGKTTEPLYIILTESAVQFLITR